MAIKKDFFERTCTAKGSVSDKRGRDPGRIIIKIAEFIP